MQLDHTRFPLGHLCFLRHIWNLVPASWDATTLVLIGDFLVASEARLAFINHESGSLGVHLHREWSSSNRVRELRSHSGPASVCYSVLHLLPPWGQLLELQRTTARATEGICLSLPGPDGFGSVPRDPSYHSTLSVAGEFISALCSPPGDPVSSFQQPFNFQRLVISRNLVVSPQLFYARQWLRPLDNGFWFALVLLRTCLFTILQWQ